MRHTNLLKLIILLLTTFIIVETTAIASAEIHHISNENQQHHITEEQNDIQISNTQGLITVDQTGEKTFTSIQEALDKSPEKSTIYIKNGIYREILIISKPITLIGESNLQTTLSPTSKKNGYAIKINTPQVTIKNLGVTNKGPGIYTTAIQINKPYTTIENCNLYDTPIGLCIWSSNNKITNCKFWDCTDEGIVLIGSKLSACKNNLIENCEFFNNCDGIEMQYALENTISNCKIYKNTHTGIDAIADSNNNNNILNCEIYDNEVHGIYLSRSSQNTIQNCMLSNNKNGAIMTIETTNTLLSNSNLDEEAKIYLYDHSTITIDNCAFESSHITTKTSEYTILNEPIQAQPELIKLQKETTNHNNSQQNTHISNLKELIQYILSQFIK